MDSNFSLLIIIVLLTTSWYYYTKYKESEKENNFLQNNVNKTNMENSNYRTRIKDLQKYKNDVSKTFKILDTELTNINNHVEKSNHFQLSTNPINSSVNELTAHSGRVNLLTPDMLNNLIDNMNQEFNFFTPSTDNTAASSTYPSIPNLPNLYQSTANMYNQQQEQQQEEHQEQQQEQQQDQHQEEQQEEQQVQLQDQQQVQLQDQQQVQMQDQQQVQSQDHDNQYRQPTFVNSVLSNETQTLGSSILRSMSFPNLPNAYQRLMIPISDTIIGRRYVDNSTKYVDNK